MAHVTSFSCQFLCKKESFEMQNEGKYFIIEVSIG